MSSAFRRKSGGPSRPSPPIGSKISVHNGEILVSSGVTALDDVISAGGIPLHSIICVKSDRYTGYTKLLLKYMISQGIESKQPVFVVAFDENVDEIVRDLPLPVSVAEQVLTDENDGGEVDLDGYHNININFIGRMNMHQQQRLVAPMRSQRGVPTTSTTPSNTTPYLHTPIQGSGTFVEERMKIAWRYQNLPAATTSFGSSLHPSKIVFNGAPYSNMFDITKSRDLESAKASGFLNLVHDNSFSSIFRQIEFALKSGKFEKTAKDGYQSHVLRIILSGFGSPFHEESADLIKHSKFLLKLKSLLRNHNVICVLSCPGYLYDDYYGYDVLQQERMNPETSNCDMFNQNKIYSGYAPDDQRIKNGQRQMRSIEHIVDGVIEVESFLGTPRKLHKAYTHAPPGAPQYHGLIHVIKLPTLSSLSPMTLKILDSSQLKSLAFRVRRKRFSIEIYTLPPEDEDDDAHSVEQSHSSASSHPVKLNGRDLNGSASSSSFIKEKQNAPSLESLNESMEEMNVRQIITKYDDDSFVGGGCSGGGGMMKKKSNPLDF